MWFFAVLFIGAFILSAFLAPKPKIENARASALSDFNFPRAKEGDPVPRGYGTYKTKGPNAIYTGDFEAVPIKKKVKTGLFSSKKQTIGYKYKIGLNLAVALGPCVTFRRMWFGKNEVWNGCIAACEAATATIDLPDLYGGQDKNGGIGGVVAFYPGAFDQAQDSYLVSKLGANVPAYVGIAHVVFRKFWFGNSASIEPISFEVSHFSDSLGLSAIGKHIMPNLLDANPIEVLYDLYVNDWGNLDVDPNLIDELGWAEAAEVVWDEGNGWSGEIGNPQQGADITKEILRQINAIVYNDPTTGVIKIKLLRADYDAETLPTMGPSEIKVVRNYTKKLWEDTFNRVRIKYQDRDKGYKDDAVAIADDFANIRFQDRIRATELGMPGCKVGALANAIAARELANLNVPLFQAELETNRTATTLRPGDVFVFGPWPEYNIVSMIVRIRKFGLGSRENGTVTMFVTQDEFAIDATVYGTPELPIGGDEEYGPQDIDEYAIFELPYFLVNASGETAVEGEARYGTFANAPGGASLDYVFMVDDTDGDVEALSNAPYSGNATIVDAIGQFDGFVTGIIPTLDIAALSSIDALSNSDEAGVKSGENLFYLNGEIFGYETFVDNLDGTYTLSNVHRGLIDTGWVAHAADDRIYFFDGQEGFVEDVFADDVPFDAYLLDRTINGRSTEAGATIEPLTPVGRAFLPAPPDYVTLDGVRALGVEIASGTSVSVDWVERNRLAPEIDLEADAATAAEAATTFDILLFRNDGHILVNDAIGSVAPFVYAIPLVATSYEATFYVYAVRDGERSFTAALYPVTVLGNGERITEDEEDRITEDGEVRTTEG